MIIWTTAGLFSLTQDEDPEYVILEARTKEEIDLLANTMRLVDVIEYNDETPEFETPHGWAIRLYEDDVKIWMGFEIEHWLSRKTLGQQFAEEGKTQEVNAFTKLMMNMEK